jgi:hypothetical protein
VGTFGSWKRTALRPGALAFPTECQEPQEDASNVRNSIARFSRVKGGSTAKRAAAWKRMASTAEELGVGVEAKVRPRGGVQ